MVPLTSPTAWIKQAFLGLQNSSDDEKEDLMMRENVVGSV